MKNFPIDISEKTGVRYLHFGSEWVQGAMRIRSPYSLELAYSRDMIYPLQLRDFTQAKSLALVIGLGSAAITKYLHRNYPLIQQTVVEICPAVVNIANQFFKLPPEDDRLLIEIDDGVTYLANSTKLYDLILVDGFDPSGDMGELASLAFFQSCAQNLTENGYFSMNLHCRSKGYNEVQQRIQQAFNNQCIFLPPTGKGNVIAVASKGSTLILND